jgi:zinc transport system permease protein
MHLAMAIGVLAAAAGIAIAGVGDTAPGATIVLVAIAVFALLATGQGAVRAWRRRAAPRAGEGDGGPVEPSDVVLSS